MALPARGWACSRLLRWPRDFGDGEAWPSGQALHCCAGKARATSRRAPRGLVVPGPGASCDGVPGAHSPAPSADSLTLGPNDWGWEVMGAGPGISRATLAHVVSGDDTGVAGRPRAGGPSRLWRGGS
eukprot:scaffold2799_cov408-Prasinococcus_capsulatus_cf.AAC.36